MIGKKRRCVKLINGKAVKPPKRGALFGEWVETDRRPTEIVTFGSFRGETMYAGFYDEVRRARLLADGTIEVDSVLERTSQNLDVRGAITQEHYALIQAGAHIARSLRCAYDDAAKAMNKRSDEKGGVK